mgnify:CR=1 FL=1
MHVNLFLLKQALVGNVKGEAELLSRFVTPQSPPSGLDSLPMVLRFVR